jgi:hypothetical protein
VNKLTVVSSGTRRSNSVTRRSNSVTRRSPAFPRWAGRAPRRAAAACAAPRGRPRTASVSRRSRKAAPSPPRASGGASVQLVWAPRSVDRTPAVGYFGRDHLDHRRLEPPARPNPQDDPRRPRPGGERRVLREVPRLHGDRRAGRDALRAISAPLLRHRRAALIHDTQARAASSGSASARTKATASSTSSAAAETSRSRSAAASIWTATASSTARR